MNCQQKLPIFDASRFGLGLSVVLAISACTGYHAKPVDPERLDREFLQLRLDSESLREELVAHLSATDGAALRQGEWRQGPLLLAAIKLNPTLAEARARIEEAVQSTTTARALPDVTVGLGSEFDLSRAAESPWLWSISTDWLLDSLLSRHLRTELADTAVRTARLDYAESLWRVRSDIRTALTSILVAVRREELLKEQADLQTKLATFIEHRVKVGETASTELVQARLEAQRTQTEYAAARQNLMTARALLAKAVGVPIEALDNLKLSWPQLESPSSPSLELATKLRAHAVLVRPDMERAIVDYQAREIELHQQVRRQYPTISMGPGYTWDHGVRKATLGISVNWPLFSGNRGPIAEALSRRETAGLHMVAVQAQIENEIGQAQPATRAALTRLAAAHAQLAATKLLADQANRALHLGATDRVTALTAQFGENVAALLELDALERAHEALSQWEDALRAPFDESELALTADDVPTKSNDRHAQETR